MTGVRGNPAAGGSGGGWSIWRVVAALAVFALALAVRAAFLHSVWQPPRQDLGGYASDSTHYVGMAYQLLAGQGYSFWGGAPDAYVSPGYPLLVAALLHLFPNAPLTAIRWCQAVMGAATAGIVVLWAGLVPGVLVALYPPFVWSTGSILTEVAFLLLFVAYLALHARLVTSPRGSTAAALVAGGVFGLAVLTRPVVVPVVFAVALVARLAGRREALGRRGLGGLVAGAAIVNLPWWLRNLVVLHRPILFAQQAANPIVAGLSPAGASLSVPAGQHAMAFALSYALAALRSRPAAFLDWMTVGKWGLLFGQPYAGGTANGNFLLSLAGYQDIVCWVGLAGLALAAIRSDRLRPAATAAATLAITLLAFLPAPRYAYPVMALLLIGAGHLVTEGVRGAVTLARRLRWPRPARPT